MLTNNDLIRRALHIGLDPVDVTLQRILRYPAWNGDFWTESAVTIGHLVSYPHAPVSTQSLSFCFTYAQGFLIFLIWGVRLSTHLAKPSIGPAA